MSYTHGMFKDGMTLQTTINEMFLASINIE